MYKMSEWGISELNELTKQIGSVFCISFQLLYFLLSFLLSNHTAEHPVIEQALQVVCVTTFEVPV